MKLIKIDEQGYFVEDVIVKEYPEILQTADDGTLDGFWIKDPLYIDIPCQGGLHLPKWDFDNECWVEGKVFSEADLQQAKESKKSQISQQIGQTINAGVMYNDKQYSCKLEDQFTVKAMLDLMTESDTMCYNSNGGSCDPFTYQELGGLLQAMMGHVKYYKTLNGEIKVYIDSLDNMDDINAFSLDSIPQSVIDATMAKLG